MLPRPSPPEWTRQLLTWLHPRETLEEVEGDLDELYVYWYRKAGKTQATLRHVLNVVSVLPPFVHRRQRQEDYYQQLSTLHPTMLRNYVKIAFRNLLLNKAYSAINIVGLTIGMIGCLAIGLFVWDEWKFDKTIPNGENIYRIYTERTKDNTTTKQAVVAPAYASFLQQHYPEVDTTTRILMAPDRFLMELGSQKNYEDKGWFVEPSFLQVFALPLEKGTVTGILDVPRTIVLSSELSKKYFGRENPVGKTIKINTFDYTVKGVLAPLPDHFHLDFHFLMSFSSVGIPPNRMERWTWNQFFTYVKVKPGTDIDHLQNKLQAYVKTEIIKPGDTVMLPFFQQLHDIHLGSADFTFDNAIRGNESYVNALMIVALFVLVIACFNFINLATAVSFRRAREIGVRKVVGAGRRQLVFQFLGETILIATIAMLIAVMALFIVVPALNRFTGKAIFFNPFADPELGLLLVGATLLVGILAGSYPAIIVSGFQPVKVLKNIRLSQNGTSWFRQGLVVVQFALSSLLIISTIVVFRQTQYMNNKDLGFSKEQLIYFQAQGDVAGKGLETFKTELRRSPNVLAVTSGYGLPGDQFAGDGVTIPGKNAEKEYSVNMFIGDHSYVKTLGLQLIAGRDFSKDMSTDVREGFIINETAVKEFGFGSPEKALGQRINWHEWVPADTSNPIKKGRIVGVVRDFHYTSLHEKVTATVIHMVPQEVFKVAVKVREADMQQTIVYINTIWSRFSPNFPLDYKFMDETYGKMYSTEEKLSELLWVFAVLAITVGCMGLFGLAAFSIEQRVKEIGIRKVLGASVLTIVALLSRNFIVLVGLAFVIATPVALWAMGSWLNDFPYRISIDWWIFALAGGLAVGIALLTVSLQSIKAALVNPVKSLRSE
ncbi:FtsX-like permease family protein [Spirosoma sp. HMF4905]|uniref:FtsX-like permease family protein n=1 Tax=Spirosoma arboris TaxID=2682092 RepID=A0A7K1SCF5_9BACT|nr:ABC transporter permease [Spirosoma arboris]MVM31470.1 FtsX-like permease family protein [Spirosoma arboris]